MATETQREQPARPYLLHRMAYLCAMLGLSDESGLSDDIDLNWTSDNAERRLQELEMLYAHRRGAHPPKGVAVATEIDTNETAVRIDHEALVTELESFYHAARSYLKRDIQLTVSIALLQHHDMERIARSLDRIANAIDSEVGLSVTAHVEER